MRKTIIKGFVLMTAATLTANAYAVGPGFYMGAMAGPATNSASTENAATLSGTPPTTPVNPKSQQFASRIFMGYKVNQYAGFEFGGTFFSTIQFNSKGIQTCASTDARVRDIEILGKGSYPLPNGFDVFAKGGVAIAYITTSGGLNSGVTECGKTQYQNKFVPTATIGASYDLSQNWVTDLSYNSVMVGGKVGKMTYFALGLSYHFVDVYCGQFLC